MTDERTDETNGETTQVPAVQKKPPAPLEAQQELLPIVPTNIEEAQRYATGLIMAGIVPDAFRHSKDVLRPVGEDGPPLARKGDINAPLVLMGVLKAMEIGVPPQTGLAGLLPLNGRFSVWGDLAAGLVQRGGQVTNQTTQWVGPSFDPGAPLGEWPEDYGCEVRYWRKGQEQPYIGRFLVRDAKRAGLWMNSSKRPWIEYPNRMLFNRARAFPLRDGFADALMGLSIAEEVLDTMPVEAIEATQERRTLALMDDTEEVTTSEPEGEDQPA